MDLSSENMKTISNLISRASVLAEAGQLSLTTISRKILNDGKGITRLQNGGQCTVKTLDKAYETLEGLEIEAKRQKAALSKVQTKPTKRSKAASTRIAHLQQLEAESIHILRECAASCEAPVMLYSAGKDSAVLLRLARKAFHPSKIPFPFLHVDTGWKFKDMIAFRDRIENEHGLKLLVYKNPEGAKKGINPFSHGADIHTDIMKTQGLKLALDKYGFRTAIAGARRDEEKSRAKERVFSLRTSGQRWNPRMQRPELWSLYNTRISKSESLRVFPLSNWTETDIWHYIHQEKIELPNLYFAALRPVVSRGGLLILADDERMPLPDREKVEDKMVRFRTLGCYPLTGACLSSAATVADIIKEMQRTQTSERHGRAIDHTGNSSMEDKKSEGYF